MDQVLSVVWSIVGGAAGGFLIAQYLSKKLVEQALSKDLERFKAEMSQRTEALKSEMSIYAHERGISRARIDGQRSTAVSAVYAALISWVREVRTLVRGSDALEPNDEDEVAHALPRARKARAASSVLQEVLETNAIYFDTATYEELDEVRREAHRLVADLLDNAESADIQGVDFEDYSKYGITDVLKIRRLFAKRIEPLFVRSIETFRSILGADVREISRPSRI